MIFKALCQQCRFELSQPQLIRNLNFVHQSIHSPTHNNNNNDNHKHNIYINNIYNNNIDNIKTA